MKTNRVLAALIVSSALLAVSPVAAAGCIKGAILGGIAAHVTHHSTLLGALGGCLVGKVVAHYAGTVTYQDVTGSMLGSDADLSQLARNPNVNIVKVSTLKGYRPGGLPARSLAATGKLDGEIAANDDLSSELLNAGYRPTDVLAVSAKGGGVIFVNA